MKRAALLLLAIGALASCDLVPRFGGAYALDTAVSIGDDGLSRVRLVLGQYGPEVAGHVQFPELGACPCVYVKGAVEGDTVRFEAEDTDGCSAPFTRGEFELTSSDVLEGSLQVLSTSGTFTDVTPRFTLSREREQSELDNVDLKGCGDE